MHNLLQTSVQTFHLYCPSAQNECKVKFNNLKDTVTYRRVLKLIAVILCSIISILGRIALAQAIPPIATHFSIAWSVICHTLAPCLNRSTDLDAIWQVHLWGTVQ